MDSRFTEFRREYLSASSLLSILQKGWVEGVITGIVASGVGILSHITWWIGVIGVGVAFIFGAMLGIR